MQREVCLALDADTRKRSLVPDVVHEQVRWWRRFGCGDNRGGDGPRSTPSTDGERVYVYDSRILFYCFDIEDGKVLWEKNIEEEFEAGTSAGKARLHP